VLDAREVSLLCFDDAKLAREVRLYMLAPPVSTSMASCGNVHNK